MDNHDIGGKNIKVPGKSGDTFSRSIHVIHGFLQAAVLAVDPAAVIETPYVRDTWDLRVGVEHVFYNGMPMRFGLRYDDVTLQDVYFLHPQWLCDVLASVVTVREINSLAKHGQSLNQFYSSLSLQAPTTV